MTMANVVQDEPQRRVASGIASVRRQVIDAATAAGRDPASVTLVAVAKLHPVDAIRAARDAGVRDIGENYVQELAAKAAAVDGVRWHFVGRLQRNKARRLVDVGAIVHSLDSLQAAQALAQRARAVGTVVEALAHVEVDDRPAAHGVRPADLPAFVTACREIDGLRLRGLMVMPAFTADPERSRAKFAKAADLARRLDLHELSMGMSHDLEVAVQEGATLVRVGTSIFGPRPERPR